MAHRGRSRFVSLTTRLRQLHPGLDVAEILIEGHQVLVDGVIVTNPAAQVRADATVQLRNQREPRGKIKLTAALEHFAVPVAGRIAADIGASTGGFTLALLGAAARRVYAIDAGHGQLLGRLRIDPRVVNLERTNIGNLRPGLVPDTVDLITVDVSYLALAQVAAQLEILDIGDDAELIALVKPMYELGLARPPTDHASQLHAVKAATGGFERHGWRLNGTMRSPILGGRGAVEHLIHLRRWGPRPPLP
jgi:23S rRNA (cytidine1920-2'-O)/16S rRNA (cytidine1409-2'-O)-methyltransferase